MVLPGFLQAEQNLTVSHEAGGCRRVRCSHTTAARLGHLYPDLYDRYPTVSICRRYLQIRLRIGGATQVFQHGDDPCILVEGKEIRTKEPSARVGTGNRQIPGNPVGQLAAIVSGLDGPDGCADWGVLRNAEAVLI